jgi:hypothetical protein
VPTIRDVFELADGLDTLSIAEGYLNIHIERREGYNALAFCPCPGHSHDHHLGNFKIHAVSGLWKCWSCSCGGHSPISLVATVRNITRKQAALDLCHVYGLITRSDYEALGGMGRELQVRNYAPKRKEEPVCCRIASPKRLDAVYRAFAKACFPIGTERRAALMKERNLSEDDMRYFISMPWATKGFMQRLEELLREAGYTAPLREILEGIPGFYWDEKYNCNSFTFCADDLGILISNSEGQITRIQIRRNYVEKGGARYIWFSSAHAHSENEQGKRFGTKSPTVADITPPATGVKRKKTIAITEGKFKSLALAKAGYWAISIQGTSSWKTAIPLAEQIKKKHDIEAAVVCFDADMHTNEGVKKAAKLTYAKLEQHGFNTSLLLWPLFLGKGYDDLVKSGHEKAAKAYSLKEYWGK